MRSHHVQPIALIAVEAVAVALAFVVAIAVACRRRRAAARTVGGPTFHRRTFSAEPVVQVEREAAAVLALRLVPTGQSGPCVCDECIMRIWRPLIASVGLVRPGGHR